MSEAPADLTTVQTPRAAQLERRRQHPLAPLLRLQGMGRVLLVGLVAGGSGGGASRWFSFVFVLVLVVARAVQWASTSYEVSDGALRMNSGFLTRRRREIPLDRVQQVDIQRGLRHRAFGLCQVTVDAAGGSGGEVTLVISDGEAARLRETLEPGGAAAPVVVGADGDVDDAPEAPRVLVSLQPGELALAGVTGAKQLVMLAALASGVQLFDDVPAVRELLARLQPTGTGLVVAAVLAVPLWFAFAAVAQLLTDFGFILTSDGALLHVCRGFPTQREASLALDRVQLARVEQTTARRLLGLASVRTGAAGSGRSSEAQVSQLTVPILPMARIDALVAGVLPGAAPLPALIPAPPAARRRQIVRRVVPATVVALVATALLWPWGALSLLLVPLGAAAGHLAYRGLGHACTSTHLVARRGGLWRRTVVMPLGRTQSARVRQSPLQRRAGLATLAVDAAGRGNVAIAVDLPMDIAASLAKAAATTAGARGDERARRRHHN